MACKCTISVTESYYVEQIAGRRGTGSKCKSILKQRTHEQVLSEEKYDTSQHLGRCSAVAGKRRKQLNNLELEASVLGGNTPAPYG